MDENLKFLKESLLFQMSLGSKELYHSNVWAWLIENDTEFVKVFFPDFNSNKYEFHKPDDRDKDGNKLYNVSRELKHRDLIIWFNEKLNPQNKYFYVIENKIKSLQREEQLKDYTEDIGDNKMLQGVVTGIKNVLNDNSIVINNETTNQPITWNFVDYNSIAERIINIAQKSDSDVIKTHYSQIEEYCKVINDLNGLLQDALKQTMNRLVYSVNKEFDECLSELRIRDLFVKMKGSEFIAYVKERESEIEIPLGFSLEINQSFHNGKTTLDIRFSNWKQNCNDYLTIGVQIEGNQYRRIVEMGNHKHEEVYDKFKGCWFDETFDESEKNRTIFGGKKTSLRKQIDKYGENFAYQYYNLDAQDCRYEAILGELKKDLNIAKRIIESCKY